MGVNQDLHLGWEVPECRCLGVGGTLGKFGCSHLPQPPLMPAAKAIELFARDLCCCGKAEVGTRLLPASPQHQGPFGAAGMVPAASGVMNPLGSPMLEPVPATQEEFGG